MVRIGLALSGGGFRATLFHLGVVRFLFEAGLLKQVKLVSAVSGGSILAAHLVLNWEKYTGSKEEFESATREVLNFVQSDVRGRVLRRWVFGCWTMVPRFLFPKDWQWSLANLLQRQYAQLFRVPVENREAAAKRPARALAYREATIEDLQGDRPGVRFNCTSLTTGDPCYFDQLGFGWYKDGVIEAPMAAYSLRVAYAVAASSAFPPLFPPVEISHKTLFCDYKSFEHEQRLTDGGIYDNLGIGALTAPYREGTSPLEHQVSLGSIIISDAEGNFDADFDTRYSFPVNRNVRASDLLMKRVSVLQMRTLEKAGEESFVRVKIREAVYDQGDKTVLAPELQRALINVRTDLDCFTPEEITALVAHGFAKARAALIDKKFVDSAAANFTWDPLGNWNEVKKLDPRILQRSRLRKWRLWSLRDPISWITGAYALVFCLVLAAPTILFALQSSIQAERAADAARVAAMAQSERTAAQGQILSGAISQIEGLMASLSSGCPGGPSGQPPTNWGALQNFGNGALRALNEARLALAGGQTSVAMQRIDSANADLVYLVDGARQSCAGGAIGANPPSWSAYNSIGRAVRSNLDGLKRLLES
jgi:predicted acylesterase/phospholipase RssA